MRRFGWVVVVVVLVLSAEGLSAEGLSADVEDGAAEGPGAEGLSAEGLSAEGLSAEGLGLRIVSPLNGEWVHEQSSKAVVEVWMTEGLGVEDQLAVALSWNDGASTRIDSLEGWEKVSADAYGPLTVMANQLSPQLRAPESREGLSDGEEAKSMRHLLKTSVIVQLMAPSVETWEMRGSGGQITMSVVASLLKKGCEEGECTLLSTQAVFTVLRSWGVVLEELSQNSALANSLMGRPAVAGRVWPPPAVVIAAPEKGQCGESGSITVMFAAVGAIASTDSLEVLLDAQQVARVGAWEREVELFDLREGEHCVTIRILDARGHVLEGAAIPEVCFLVADSCVDLAGDGALEEHTVLMVTWMPPVHHVTGMSERLWQVAEKLLHSGKRVLVASKMCGPFSFEQRAELDPRLTMLACGPQLHPSVISSLVIQSKAATAIVASWWFNFPMARSQPEIWLPDFRDFQPQVAVLILVDDLFIPFPYPYNDTVPPDQTSLLATCGAQTIALAASDGVGTLTSEDESLFREVLTSNDISIRLVRYSVSDVAVREQTPPAFKDRWFHRKLLYIGSCHAANEAALRWLLESVIPHFSRALIESEEDPSAWTLAIVGNVTPQTCAPSLCEGDVCGAEHAIGLNIQFLGYVPSVEALMDETLVLVSPRWGGLGLSTKVMLGLERGLPTVTTPHGTTGYNITDWSGSEGVLVASNDDPHAFAQQMNRFLHSEELWNKASAGAKHHAWETFSPEQQQQDILSLMHEAHNRRQMSL